MTMAAMGRTEELGIALFEQLLATPLELAEQDGKLTFTMLEDDQRALPVFLDQAALRRFAPGGASRPSTAQAAARLAIEQNAWLVLEPGSEPGGVPVGHSSAALLCSGTHPLAAASRPRRELVAELTAELRAGANRVGASLKDRAGSALVVSLGVPPTGSAKPPKLTLGSVAGAGGQALVPVWPTMSGSFEYHPAPVPRVTLPLARLIDLVIETQRGLVVEPEGDALSVSAARLASWWR
jgi:hypothetical protein